MSPTTRYALLREIRGNALANLHLNPAEKAVLLYLQLRRLLGAESPDQDEIVSEMELSGRTVSAALRRLRIAGFVLAYKPVTSVNDEKSRRARSQV